MQALRFVLLGSALVAALLLVAGTATAAKPAVVTYHEEGTYTDTTTCAFAIEISYVNDIRETFFFDDEELPIRELANVDSTGILTGPSGRSVTDNERFNFTWDFVDGTRTWAGLTATINIPGEGAVYLDAGRVVLNASFDFIFLAGPKDSLAPEGWKPVCDYLAGP